MIPEYRIPITVEQYYKEDHEETAYTYNKEADDDGLDPWRRIDGLDKYVKKDVYILWIGRTGEKDVEPDYVIYIDKK